MCTVAYTGSELSAQDPVKKALEPIRKAEQDFFNNLEEIRRSDPNSEQNNNPYRCAQKRCPVHILKKCLLLQHCKPLIKQGNLYTDTEIMELVAETENEQQTQSLIDAGIIGVIIGGVLATFVAVPKVWRNRHRFKPSKVSKGLISFTVVWVLGVHAYQLVIGDLYRFWHKFLQPENFGLMIFPPALVAIGVSMWIWSKRA